MMSPPLDAAALGRRTLLGSLLATPGLLAVSGGGAGAAGAPLALVYRGPAADPGCPEAVAQALRHRGVMRSAYVGPSQATKLTPAALRGATLYVQPGGDTVASAWPHMRPYRRTITAWVRGGGHYLGLCLGAYLATDDPGFGLWPGDIVDYKTVRAADSRSSTGRIATINWRGRPRAMYVEDPPSITLHRRVRRVSILARYSSGHVAAASVPVGRGRVTVVGPHPEAPPSWYRGLGGPARWQPGAWIDVEKAAVA